MIDLLWNAITHIPERMIRDRTRIGNDSEGFQYVLVFEDWEFRVYQYQYNEYEDGNNWEECSHYFYNFDYWLNLNTLAYTRLDIDWERGRTRDELIAYAREYLTDRSRDFEDRIRGFFKKYINELGAKVYQYYK